MGKSGNPAKAAATAKVSSAKDFKKKQGGIFELPSGLFVKLKNPGGMQALLGSGMMPNSLMAIVQKSLSTGKEFNAKDVMSDGGVDPKFINEMTQLLDNLTVLCMVEPKVLPVPETEDLRDDELLYVDEIDENDKMFIFQWVSGGTSDLETFRKRSAASVDTVAKVAEAGSDS